MVAALCAFVGNGVVIAADKPAANKPAAAEQPAEGSSLDLTSLNFKPKKASSESKKKTTEATTEDTLFTKIKAWFGSSLTADLNDNDVLRVVQIIQDHDEISDAACKNIKKALEEDDDIYDTDSASAAYKRYGVTNQLVKVDNSLSIRCFVAQLQRVCAPKIEAILDALALDHTLNHRQIETVKAVLTTIDKKNIKIWEQLAAQWKYTYSLSNYTTYFPWWVFNKIMNNKVVTTLAGYALYSLFSASTPETPVK